jgi:amino acid transporter
VAALTTLVEIGGLLLVVFSAGDNLAELPQRLPEMLPGAGGATLVGLIAGAFLAFYAFIGFEDIVNVAEEVKRPQRDLPRAVVLSLLIAGLLYMVVAVVAVLELPPAELAQSSAPLARVYEHASGEAPYFISAISLAAVLNGALIQIIMASRVLYGMARQGWLPGWLAEVNAATRTPLHTTVLMATAMLVLALWLPLQTLAEISSLITLTVFALVNLSLWRIKGLEPQPEGVPNIPRWLPLGGLMLCTTFILFQLWHWAA